MGSSSRRKNDGESKPSAQISHSAVTRVSGSWDLVKPYQQEVGIEFFLRLFKKFPHLLALFPFGNVVDPSDLTTSKALQAHAGVVMKTVGEAVVGLSDIETLIPKLRALGKMHTLVGVQPEHYDALYSILMGAIRDKIEEEVGPQYWCNETDEAWQVVYGAITSVMKEPTRQLETEHVAGWGLLIALSCAWFCIATPFEIAGFADTNIWLRLGLAFLNSVAFFTMFVDLIALWVLDAVALKEHKRVKIRSIWHLRYRRLVFRVKFYTNRMVRRIRLEQWLPWPKEDAIMLVTFPLQLICLLSTSSREREAHGVQGVHWLTLFVLFRLIAARRVLHFVRCAETSSFLEYRMHSKGRANTRVWKLVGVLLYVMHVAACVWSILVKVEIGLGFEEAVSESTSFELGGKLYGYLTAIHWAWVSLAGIGNTEIVPTTSLQIVVTLAVHLVGATLYAVVTGQVLSMLQDYAEKDNMMANEIGALSEFMANCNIPSNSRERIITSYFMQNHLSRKGSHVVQREEEESSAPELPEKILAKLPSHHKQELLVYTRTEAARWRSRQQLSSEFCYALSESLSKTASLLAGDYLFRSGDKVKRGVMLIENGTLEVIVNGTCVQTLTSGDIIGKGWLSTKKGDTSEMKAARLYADYLNVDGRARASIRAMTSCRYVSGINLKGQAMDMQTRFPEDIKNFRTSANTRGMKWLKSIVNANRVLRALGGNKSNRHPSKGSKGSKGSRDAATNKDRNKKKDVQRHGLIQRDDTVDSFDIENMMMYSTDNMQSVGTITETECDDAFYDSSEFDYDHDEQESLQQYYTESQSNDKKDVNRRAQTKSKSNGIVSSSKMNRNMSLKESFKRTKRVSWTIEEEDESLHSESQAKGWTVDEDETSHSEVPSTKRVSWSIGEDESLYSESNLKNEKDTVPKLSCTSATEDDFISKEIATDDEFVVETKDMSRNFSALSQDSLDDKLDEMDSNAETHVRSKDVVTGEDECDGSSKRKLFFAKTRNEANIESNERPHRQGNTTSSQTNNQLKTNNKKSDDTYAEEEKVDIYNKSNNNNMNNNNMNDDLLHSKNQKNAFTHTGIYKNIDYAGTTSEKMADELLAFITMHLEKQ